MKRFASDYFPGLVLFSLFIVIALIIFKDYGISWDESAQRYIGMINYTYVFEGSNEVCGLDVRYYGVGFEMPLIFFEKWFKLTDAWDVYYMRHIVSHLFFLFSCFCGYVLVFRLYRNKFIAIAGFLMLVMMPRIYAHSFFNSKDVPLLSMFLITFTVAQIAFEKKSLLWSIILGIVCGYTAGIRISGCLLTGFISLFFLFDILSALIKKEKTDNLVLQFSLFLASFYFVLYTIWPVLWPSPILKFIEAYRIMSHFVIYDACILLNGQMLAPSKLPFIYFPTWFSITTPVVWLLAGISGLIALIVNIARKPVIFLKNTFDRNLLLYVLCFITPIILIAVLNPVLYDDWRHFYFVYPSFVLLGLYILNMLYKSKYKLIVISVFIIQFVFTAYFMISNHPFQEVYFNPLVSHKSEYLRKNYDLDYWGPSVKQGLEYIAKNDKSPKIKVCNHVLRIVLSENIALLPHNDRNRFEYVTEDSNPDYFITNYRLHPDDYNYPEIFYKIKVLNSTILSIYKVAQ